MPAIDRWVLSTFFLRGFHTSELNPSIQLPVRKSIFEPVTMSNLIDLLAALELYQIPPEQTAFEII